MSVVIIGGFSFPEGNAATNRVHTYAKGFVENGINVHVISFSNKYNSSGDGSINGVNYYDPFGQTKRNKYLIIRSLQKFNKFLKTTRLIRRIHKSDKITFFNSWLRLFHWQLFVFVLAKFLNAKLILERNEHPLRGYEGSYLKQLQGNIKLYFDNKFCNGIFCISHYLIDFYKSKGINAENLLLVPSTVDPSRFTSKSKPPFNYKYIGYFGGLTFKRDNVDLLIRAFARISNDFPEVRLVLGGFCSAAEKKQMTGLINELKITGKVELLEYMERNEVIKYIVHSHLLVMVRSIGIESQASFPSKLTEFLATAKPVIAVDVGEVSEYLSDGVNAFIVKPENIDSLAEKLVFVLENYDFARKIGRQGKQLTDTVFNYRFQARRMLEFVNEKN